jgi:hypothetical protein
MPVVVNAARLPLVTVAPEQSVDAKIRTVVVDGGAMPTRFGAVEVAGDAGSDAVMATAGGAVVLVVVDVVGVDVVVVVGFPGSGAQPAAIAKARAMTAVRIGFTASLRCSFERLSRRNDRLVLRSVADRTSG